jgi:hypothetical protein
MSRANGSLATNRRELLRAGLYGTAMTVVGANLERTARAQGVAPARFLFIYTPAGREPSWRTGTPGPDFTFGPTMKMFEPYRKKTVLFDGFTLVNFLYKYNAHWASVHTMLGGKPPVEDARASMGYTSFGSQRTFDHLLADRIGKYTAVRNIVVGGPDTNNQGRGLEMSWSAPKQSQRPIHDPARTFSSLFGGAAPPPMPGDSKAIEAARKKQEWEKTVLGLSRAQMSNLKARLGRPEQIELEAYETRLKEAFDTVSAQTGSVAPEVLPRCEKTPAMGSVGGGGAQAHLDLQSKTLAAAFACGRTKVGVYMMAPVTGGNGHHLHDDKAFDHYRKFDLFYGDRVKFLLDEMSKYPEGNGTLLDNTVILWSSDISWGPAAHSNTYHPIYMFGGLPRGKLKMGQYVKVAFNSHREQRGVALSDRSNRRLPEILLTIAQAMGIDDIKPADFMDTEYYQGPVSEILA